MKIRSKIISFILISGVSVASNLTGKYYQMDDLISLQSSKDYIEILDHIFDIPPKKRSEEWNSLLQNAALAVTEQLNKSLTYPKDLYQKIYRLTSRPYLKTNQIFYDSFLKLTLRETISCLENPDKTQHAKCLLAPFELLKTYVDQEHFTKFYNLFNRYSKEKGPYYESLLRVFVTTLLPQVKFNSPTHLCSTEKIKSIYFMSIKDNKRLIVPELCFKIMQSYLLQKSYDLDLDQRIDYLKSLRLTSPPQLLKKLKYLSVYQNLGRNFLNKNYKKTHIELLKIKSKPNLRDDLLNYLKSDNKFHDFTISANYKKPLFRDLNRNFPELISWYYRVCKRNDTAPLGEEFCQRFNSLNQKEQFI